MCWKEKRRLLRQLCSCVRQGHRVLPVVGNNKIRLHLYRADQPMLQEALQRALLAALITIGVVITLAALAALIACFLSGACELAALAAVLGFAGALLVVGVLRDHTSSADAGGTAGGRKCGRHRGRHRKRCRLRRIRPGMNYRPGREHDQVAREERIKGES